jgi:hypothetical protein
MREQDQCDDCNKFFSFYDLTEMNIKFNGEDCYVLICDQCKQKRENE